MLLVRTQPNFDGWLVTTSVLVGNCLGAFDQTTFVPATFVQFSL